MNNYRKLVKEQADKTLSRKEALGDIDDIYYNNRDMKLLLDLLANSSGVATALAVLSVFDKVTLNY